MLFMGSLLAIILSLLAIFLVLLVLVQRGRGGGLAGALGGAGGSSAFGAKAGDVFTKITIVVATIWIIICVCAAYWSKHRSDSLGTASPTINSTDRSTGTGETIAPLGDDSQGSESAPASDTQAAPKADASTSAPSTNSSTDQ
jgi:preprotein translocase subunit SecG